jgi:hypothetical protein
LHKAFRSFDGSLVLTLSLALSLLFIIVISQPVALSRQSRGSIALIGLAGRISKVLKIAEVQGCLGNALTCLLKSLMIFEAGCALKDLNSFNEGNPFVVNVLGGGYKGGKISQRFST